MQWPVAFSVRAKFIILVILASAILSVCAPIFSAEFIEASDEGTSSTVSEFIPSHLAQSVWQHIATLEGARDITLSPTFVADQTMFTVAEGAGVSEDPMIPLYRSTDGGANWQHVRDFYYGSTIAISPGYATDRTLFVVEYGGCAPSPGYYRSTDGGESWTGLPVSNLYAHSIVLSPNFSSDHTLYLISDAEDACGEEGRAFNGVYRSTDQGVSLELLQTPFNQTARALALSPAFPTDRTIWTSSCEPNTDNSEIFRSTNGGDSWTKISNTPVGACILYFFVTPNYPSSNTIFAIGAANSTRSLWRSSDGGANWLSIGATASVALSPNYATDRTLYRITVDGVPQYSTNEGDTWNIIATTGLDGNLIDIDVAPRQDGTYTLLATARDDFKNPPEYSLSRYTADLPNPTEPSPPTKQAFLDLPFQYDGLYATFERHTKYIVNGGLISSWFDHDSPNGTLVPNTRGIVQWDGRTFDDVLVNANGVNCYLENGVESCYDGHRGIDLVPYKNGEIEIYPAADGVVALDPIRSCPNEGGEKYACNSGYGNSILIYHPSYGYFTRYSHLQPHKIPASVTRGTSVTVNDVIGIMGNSGRSGGTHLDFEVYKDVDNNGVFSFGKDTLVDPFGWNPSPPLGNLPDPWLEKQGVVSHWLWVQSEGGPSVVRADTDTEITHESGIVSALFPAHTYSQDTQVQIRAASLPLSPLSGFHSLGVSYWIFEASSNQVSAQQSYSASSLPNPVTIEFDYSSIDLSHFRVDNLQVHRWDSSSDNWQPLESKVEEHPNTVIYATTDSLGLFALVSSPQCHWDSSEIDDSYFNAHRIFPNDLPHVRAFDGEHDEDWFTWDAVAGYVYIIDTLNLAEGVDTILELIGSDGRSHILSDDDGGGNSASQLIWQATETGAYYIRVTRHPNGRYDCEALYELQVITDSLLGTPPAMPEFISPSHGAEFAQGTDVTLKWNGASRATRYAVEIWKDGGLIWFSGRIPATAVSVGYLPAGSYTWHVEAYNDAGWSGWAEPARDFIIVASGPSTGNDDNIFLPVVQR